MKSSGLSAVTLVPLVMAAFSLFSMIGLLQIDRMVRQDLYRYGLHFSIGWAKPYWDISMFVFAAGWFNIILAVAFQLYVVTYGRREAKQFAAEVGKEIVNIETNPSENVEEQTVQASPSSETQEKEQVTPDQSVQSETPKEQEPEASKSPETEQKDMKPETEEKKEETPIIIGLTEEELQTSS